MQRGAAPPNMRWCRPGVRSAFYAYSVGRGVSFGVLVGFRPPGGTARRSALDRALKLQWQQFNVLRDL